MRKLFQEIIEIFLNGGDFIKVLIVSSYPLPTNAPVGGVERVTINLVHSLSDFDYIDLNVLSRMDNIEKDFILEKKNNLKIYYFAKRKPKIVTSLFRDLPALKKKIMEIDPDIVHAQGADGAYAALCAGYPTVMTLHGIIWREMKFFNGVKGFGRRLIFPNLTKYVLKRLKHFIIINPYVDKETKYLTNARKYYVNNPIEDKFFELENEEVYGRIFYLGVINTRKDLMTLIKAIPIIQEKIPEAHLRIAGKVIEKKYYSDIIEYIDKNNINGIKFLGQLNDSNIDEEYKTCSIFCLPSRQETAPMAICEAMAAGKPVVSTNICGMPYMVNNGDTGYLFEPGNVQALSEYIIKLLKNITLRRQMGINARHAAMENFFAKIVATKTSNIYKEILLNERNEYL